jgi:excinuclease ABC A subunit
VAKKLTVAGAREHNLKDITVEIPRDTLAVITGVSGSGKSSLAFDTIYVEGQRRYVESLSAYARQFLGQFKKPDVDRVEGLSPAISIEQKSVSKNPRSTVGTATEIYDYLRVLFARIGEPHCYQCGRPINPQTIAQMIRQITKLPEGSRLILLAPVISGKKGEHKRELNKLRKMGFIRARVDGEIRDLEEEIELDRYKQHTIEVVVDRLVMKEGIARRLRDSLETALSLSEGIVRLLVNNNEEIVFSERLACIHCGISYPEITPRTFSFNSPYGACPACGGLGTKEYFDPNLVIPDPTLSIREGAIAPWQRRHSFFYYQMIEALADHYRFDIYQPFYKLPKRIQQAILYGSGGETIRFFFDHGDRRHFRERPFEGVIPRMERIYRETESDAVREEIRKYMNFTDCPACKGTRLKKEALSVLLGAEAAGFSATTISRLLRVWQDEYQEWRKRSLKGKEYVYVWADGIHFQVRLEEDRLAFAADVFKLCLEKHVNLVLPSDAVVSREISETADVRELPVRALEDDLMGLDIGGRTVKSFEAVLDASRTVLWNGPMGVFEMSPFQKGTRAIAAKLCEITEQGATTIVGGGDSAAALKKFGLAGCVSHTSTGGGASLELLSGVNLPAFEALKGVFDKVFIFDLQCKVVLFCSEISLHKL